MMTARLGLDRSDLGGIGGFFVSLTLMTVGAVSCDLFRSLCVAPKHTSVEIGCNNDFQKPC